MFLPVRGHNRGHDSDRGDTDGDSGSWDAGGESGRRSRALKAVGLGLTGVLMLGVAAAGLAYWHLNQNIKGVDINSALGDDRPPRPLSAPSAGTADLPSGALNILVLGSDSRSGAQNKELGGGDSEGARSDTAMIVHIDAGRTSATVVSIPRDTLVTRPSCPLESGGSTAVAHYAMFNSAYSVGGPVCAVKTAEMLTGIRMDHYVEIDFSGFAKLVDAMGGVTVTTELDIDDDKSHLHLKAGTHHLGGTDALALARTRYGVGDGSDLGRIGLQQRLVKALLEQMSDSGLLNDPAGLYRVADAVTGSLTTDTGLDSLGELTTLGESLRGLSAQNVKTVTMPVVTAPWNPNRVVEQEPDAAELWTSLR
ncbi:LCP family protein [Streptomyces sp. NPDC058451]|uniref:LCP family protein n=1 Tax=unclassified Streptomyces TaxID=2593676 RepID=UPI0036644FBB